VVSLLIKEIVASEVMIGWLDRWREVGRGVTLVSERVSERVLGYSGDIVVVTRADGTNTYRKAAGRYV
jgi:hypothetical protein